MFFWGGERGPGEPGGPTGGGRGPPIFLFFPLCLPFSGNKYPTPGAGPKGKFGTFGQVVVKFFLGWALGWENLGPGPQVNFRGGGGETPPTS